ncbi:MAG: DNA-3-methyladenine glycosylase [Gemmatimonadota bacterium]
MPKPLPLSFFRRPAEVVAPELLGCTLTVTQRSSSARPPIRLSAIITEVEAYLGVRDPGSHVWNGRRTPTTTNLYAPPGTWYVYRSHGLHWCCNLTTKGPEEGHAVLLRGVVVTDARTLKVVQRRRGAVVQKDLTNGPGKLTQALGIDRSLDGVLMAGSWAQVFAEGTSRDTQHPIRLTPRIGLTRAVDWPLRWLMK